MGVGLLRRLKEYDGTLVRGTAAAEVIGVPAL
jgi:hypothetical protein